MRYKGIGADGGNRTHTPEGNGFSYRHGFHRHAASDAFASLDYPFAIAFALGAARLVSTPSLISQGLARD